MNEAVLWLAKQASPENYEDNGDYGDDEPFPYITMNFLLQI